MDLGMDKLRNLLVEMGQLSEQTVELHERVLRGQRPVAREVHDDVFAELPKREHDAPAKPSRKPQKATGQKEMLLPIEGKKPAKERTAKKTASKPQRRSA